MERRKELEAKLKDLETSGDLVIDDDIDQHVLDVADICDRLLEAQLFPKEGAIGLDPYGTAALFDELISRGYAFTLALQPMLVEMRAFGSELEILQSNVASNAVAANLADVDLATIPDHVLKVNAAGDAVEGVAVNTNPDLSIAPNEIPTRGAVAAQKSVWGFRGVTQTLYGDETLTDTSQVNALTLPAGAYFFQIFGMVAYVGTGAVSSANTAFSSEVVVKEVGGGELQLTSSGNPKIAFNSSETGPSQQMAGCRVILAAETTVRIVLRSGVSNGVGADLHRFSCKQVMVYRVDDE